jgi:hypothetical protein
MTESQKLQIKISAEYYHHHADGILKKHNDVAENFKASLENQVSLEVKERTKQGRKSIGLTADSLNREVRRLLANIPNIEFEVDQNDGVYYKSEKIIGFDFALIDKTYNLYNLRNLCFGKKRLFVGERIWDDYLRRHPAYNAIAEQTGLPRTDLINGDIQIERNHPVIVGEIQFGNWALAYRDFFKVLKANVLTDVDLLIYIVADDLLASKLSDGIVNFKQSKEIISEFAKVITVPIWLIGINIDLQEQP